MSIDSRSVLVVTALLLVVCAAIVASMRRKLPSSVQGAELWIAGAIAIACGMALVGQRERVDEWFSTVAGNALLWTGMSACLGAIRRFTGRRVPVVTLATGGVLFVAASAWTTVLNPDYRLRLASIAFFLCLIYLALFMAALAIRPRHAPAKLMVVSFGCAAGVTAIRTLAVLGGFDRTDTLFASTPYQVVFLLNFGLSWLFANIAFILMLNEHLYEALSRAAAYDPLSGLPNRGAVMTMLEREIDRAGRNASALSVLMLDLDHFKSINDRHGHMVGDRAIVDFATRAPLQLRRSDVLGRYGGEEFLAILADTDLGTASQVAERLRSAIEQENGTGFLYTVSIGVAEYRPGMTYDDLVALADQAMYRAKQNGRNRVELAAEHGSAIIRAKSLSAAN